MITPSSLCSLHFSPTYTGTLVPTVAQERDKRKNRGEETDPAGKGQTHTHTRSEVLSSPPADLPPAPAGRCRIPSGPELVGCTE